MTPEHTNNPEVPVANSWEDLYQKNENPWGTEPLEALAESVNLLHPGTVLDLGGGDGRNGLFLARSGFEVTTYDIAASAITALEAGAEKQGLQDKIHGVVTDLSKLGLDRNYDNIISTFTLHFLNDEAFQNAITQMIEHTEPGGINYIEDFIKDSSLWSPTTRTHWIADAAELRTYYESAGWEILRADHREVSARSSVEGDQNFGVIFLARSPD